MKGHGEKYSRKKDDAITALLSKPSIAEAAKAADIGESTLRRWQKKDDFKKDYLKAKKKVVSHSILDTQKGMTKAVQVLKAIMNNEDTAASARVSAARAMLNFGYKALLLDDLISRVENLEEPS